MFFSIFIFLINFACANGPLDLGPHLRVDKTSFSDLKITKSKILLLVSPDCSYCKVQLRKLECLNNDDVVVLVDKSDGNDLHKLRIPKNMPVYLTTKTSRDLFSQNLVYPMGLILTQYGLKFFRGLYECDMLQEFKQRLQNLN